jgi:hypothetical protein
MTCRLYGEETNNHFRMEWFPMAYTVVKNDNYFNWDNILSFNIANRVLEPKGMKNPCFYMSSYIIDKICATNCFLSFNWAWTSNQIHVHVYYSKIWEANSKENFYDICDCFLPPLHKPIFGSLAHRIFPRDIKSLKGIERWYMKKYYTYVRIFGATGQPHLLQG